MLCTRVKRLSTYDDTKSFASLLYPSTRHSSNTTAAKKVVTDHNLIWKVGALNVASYNSFFKVTNQHIVVNGFHKIILWAADTLFHLTSITVHFPCLTLNMEISGGRGWGGGG